MRHISAILGRPSPAAGGRAGLCLLAFFGSGRFHEVTQGLGLEALAQGQLDHRGELLRFRRAAHVQCRLARSVTTGPDDGKFTVIREGLAEGDEILLAEPSQ